MLVRICGSFAPSSSFPPFSLRVITSTGRNPSETSKEATKTTNEVFDMNKTGGSPSTEFVRLRTTAPNPLQDAIALQDFLARPSNWPLIVASSERVEASSLEPRESSDDDSAPANALLSLRNIFLQEGRQSVLGATDVNLPLQPGQTIDEYFGLGLLKVQWTCDELIEGVSFQAVSPDGVTGVASDCRMDFQFSDCNTVEFVMSFRPRSPIAYLATPVLVFDNWIALNVLLPLALKQSQGKALQHTFSRPEPLDSFRKLMGSLYGVAGLAHAADLAWGGSQLFTQFGIPPIGDLEFQGRTLAWVWCAMGPLCFLLSRVSAPPAEMDRSVAFTPAETGLILYGLVEVFGSFASGVPSALQNAVLVQVLVGASWAYSSQKQTEV